MALKIVRLSEEVINQIAAGEVVENPASIVKELIENSLDAGARRIEIAIEGGGIFLIRIEDDGCGMNKEDALLSLERHATSKIRTAEDLDKLQTMGFRGEALAAISAVSLFELRTNDGFGGTSIRVEGGRIFDVKPCARNLGTTIEIRSLFFNTPARKKFLKSAAANTVLVSRVVETLALAHPEIAFLFTSQGEVMLEREAEKSSQRVENILGKMPVEIDLEKIQGWLSLPEEAKTHRKGQYLFINKRPIFSPLISRAVKMGYGTRLAENSHPGFVLFLNIAPEEIDVNVHPQKKEVRFSDEKEIFRLVQHAVAKAFGEEMKSFSSSLFFSPAPLVCSAEPSQPLSQNIQAEPLSFNFAFPQRPLAIIDHFLLLQREGFFLIDLQAAHARVLFETLEKKKGEAQMLLHPIELTDETEETFEELTSLGVECRWIGKTVLAIDALPRWLDISSFDSFLSSWKKGKKKEVATLNYCRSLKKKYTLEEALALWEELHNCQEPQLDPNLKPIWIQLEKQHLQTLFG